MRYAVIDVGTNSCRLLVAEVEDRSMNIIEKKVVSTRIGEGLINSGWINPNAISRTLLCLSQFGQDIESCQVDKSKIVATSALRDAANREDFLHLAGKTTGMAIEVLSGEKEGQLSYLGAKGALNLKRNPLVLDIGGGSTEISYQSREIISLSIPIGAVRGFEADWNEEDSRAQLINVIPLQAQLRQMPLVLVGGTATSLVTIKKIMKKYDFRQVHGAKLSLREINRIYEELGQMNVEERRQIPGLQPERADIIVKGIMIIKCAMDILNRRQAIVSDSDLLEGLVMELHKANQGEEI
ncbi:MAG: Ppx/GppA family phosphatase [Syntrophomonadaceae bacterium]|nr:Ppx/GppA family phosphatase [Syntrophomonadaceae bacterium]